MGEVMKSVKKLLETKVVEHLERVRVIHEEIDKALNDPEVMKSVKKLLDDEGMAKVASVVEGMVSLLPAQRKEMFQKALKAPGCERKIRRARTLEEFAK